MGPANKKGVSFSETEVQASETEVDGLTDSFAQLDVEKDSTAHDTLASQANPASEHRATDEASVMHRSPKATVQSPMEAIESYDDFGDALAC